MYTIKTSTQKLLEAYKPQVCRVCGVSCLDEPLTGNGLCKDCEDMMPYNY